MCEYEANRYKKLWQEDIAGVFKKQARLSALSISKWLLFSPPRSIKNGFHPESSHGYDLYADYSCYYLLIASQFGFANLIADDTIEEKELTPSEKGGCVLHLPN